VKQRHSITLQGAVDVREVQHQVGHAAHALELHIPDRLAEAAPVVERQPQAFGQAQVLMQAREVLRDA
jgi:hypothetical protein